MKPAKLKTGKSTSSAYTTWIMSSCRLEQVAVLAAAVPNSPGVSTFQGLVRVVPGAHEVVLASSARHPLDAVSLRPLLVLILPSLWTFWMDTVLPHRRRNTWAANQFPGASATGATANMPYENLGPYAGEHIEIGSELSAEAPVWKAYVLESDRQDKEMCDDWDRSLDVLLVFAALFSAISTAFILESMKKLQPDPADITASTLLDISRTLVAISNGQSPPPLNTTASEQAPFTPSPATIWINSLCQKMVPQVHVQALGWRMQGVMDVLPALMHIALALFVAGLVVLLWDTNQQVALPVVVVSSVFFALYVAITILPTISTSCPYETALSEAFKWLLLVPPCILLGAQAILLLTWSLVFRMLSKLWGYRYLHGGLRQGFLKIRKNTLHKVQRLMHLIKLRPLLSSMDERHSSNVPMDDTTSGALYWLISNSEHSDHVNIALQAISGAELHLMDALRKDWILNQIEAQLRMWCMGATRGNAAPSHAGHHRVLVSLFRALSRALATDPRCNVVWYDLSLDQWREYLTELYHHVEAILPAYEVLFRYQDSDPPKDEVTAHNAAAMMIMSYFDLQPHFERELLRYSLQRLDPDLYSVFRRSTKGAVSSAIMITKRHLNGDIVLSRSALVALSEGFMYFILREIFNRGDQNRFEEALIILVRIYLQQSEISSERLRYTIAVALASAALASDRNYIEADRYRYSGGGAHHPAVKLISQYLHKEMGMVKNSKVMRDLFVFGITRMLPTLGYSILDSDLEPILGECKRVGNGDRIYRVGSDIARVATLKPPLLWIDHLANTIMTCLQQLPIVSCSTTTEANIVRYLKGLSENRRLSCPRGEPTRDSVQGLCNVRSNDLWDFGLKFLVLDPSRSGETALRRVGQCELAEQLYQVSRDPQSPVSPQAMQRLLRLIKDIVECEGAAPESIESAFGSLKTTVDFPRTPAEIVSKLNLEEIWYKRLDAMISSEDVQEVDGSFIAMMTEGYTPEESVREKWQELGRRLEAKKEMARQGMAEPDHVEAESAGADSSGQGPVESENGGVLCWGPDY
ncbi:hypothetical protein RhiLY_12813 [Ceratobasidium sp. AG-Ba]|nr:hypothetical protein RhiLY_12813 [Ceratobasidium sp. AG-Ba]